MKLHERLEAIMTSNLDATARMVLVVIADAMSSTDAERPVWRSAASIAERAGLARSTTIEVLKRLEAAGVVTTDAREDGAPVRRHIDWRALASLERSTSRRGGWGVRTSDTLSEHRTGESEDRTGSSEHRTPPQVEPVGGPNIGLGESEHRTPRESEHRTGESEHRTPRESEHRTGESEHRTGGSPNIGHDPLIHPPSDPPMDQPPSDPPSAHATPPPAPAPAAAPAVIAGRDMSTVPPDLRPLVADVMDRIAAGTPPPRRPDVIQGWLGCPALRAKAIFACVERLRSAEWRAAQLTAEVTVEVTANDAGSTGANEQPDPTGINSGGSDEQARTPADGEGAEARGAAAGAGAPQAGVDHLADRRDAALDERAVSAAQPQAPEGAGPGRPEGEAQYAGAGVVRGGRLEGPGMTPALAEPDRREITPRSPALIDDDRWLRCAGLLGDIIEQTGAFVRAIQPNQGRGKMLADVGKAAGWDVIEGRLLAVRAASRGERAVLAAHDAWRQIQSDGTGRVDMLLRRTGAAIVPSLDAAIRDGEAPVLPPRRGGREEASGVPTVAEMEAAAARRGIILDGAGALVRRPC